MYKIGNLKACQLKKIKKVTIKFLSPFSIFLDFLSYFFR